MAEDFDVEALLEAPYNSNGINKLRKDDEENERRKRRSKSRERHRDRSKDRKRHRDSRERRDRSKDRERRTRSLSKERRRKRSSPEYRERSRRNRSRDRRSRDRSRDKSRDRHRRHEDRKKYDDYSPRRSPSYKEEKILEEADKRTVFCMQLAARVRVRDLEDFFAKCGKVREVRLIMDNKTRKHKGIAYIEFRDSSSVPVALQLNGQKLCGYPITIQPTQAEKNRTAILTSNSNNTPTSQTSSKKATNTLMQMRLYVGSLHFNVSEEMLRGIFEPFGTIQKIELMRDTETLRSKGYGFITFSNAENAKTALEQLNGYELACRPMKVGYVTERGPDGQIGSTPSQPTLDSEELDKTGIDLGATGRIRLMQKLAEGTGIELPKAAVNVLNQCSNNDLINSEIITTECFMLTNMFNPDTEEDENWPEIIREEVIEECRKYGGVSHVYVDSLSKTGNVYVKATSVASALKSVTALHARWFNGKLITAAYIPLASYHQLFPDSLLANTAL